MHKCTKGSIYPPDNEEMMKIYWRCSTSQHPKQPIKKQQVKKQKFSLKIFYQQDEMEFFPVLFIISSSAAW